jgi:hypothetical protein
MWLEAVLPGLLAVIAGVLAWQHDTRRLDRRALDEERGTPEDEFRQPHLARWRRHRLALTVSSAVAGLATGWLLVLLIGL